MNLVLSCDRNRSVANEIGRPEYTTQEVLDHSRTQLESSPTASAGTLGWLISHLGHLKKHQPPEVWNRTIAECRAHPLRELLHQDPLTSRSYKKSRGYQGDAELLDIIYASDYRPFQAISVTELGHSIFQCTINRKAPSAVRNRRKFLARQIDSTCRDISSARVLSVACGHLREAELSEAVQNRSLARFVALDHDSQSLGVVISEYGYLGIETVWASVKALLGGCLANDKFDFIYAAGLYDYLEARWAQCITRRLFGMLRPGGRLLVANYLHGLEDTGYMEAYADWYLIYRDATAMRALAETITAPVRDLRTFTDDSQTIGYLELFAP